MASQINSSIKHSSHSFPSRPVHFQRREGPIKTKKIKRKIKLKFKHIFLSFLLLGGIFYSFQKTYLFLISWDNLNVKDIEIVCSKSEVLEEIQQTLKGKKLGNLLLLDINRFQEALAAHRWIQEVRIRKIFPSTLKIEIKERVPFALLQKENLFLIDKEGTQLEAIESREKIDLPLLIDTNNFQKDYKEKLELAWKCLCSLSSPDKEQIDVLDLTEYKNVSIQLKNKQTKLILGDNQFSQKLQFFKKNSAVFNKYGELEYADLRFNNMFFIKPKKNSHRDIIPNLTKEAN